MATPDSFVLLNLLNWASLIYVLVRELDIMYGNSNSYRCTVCLYHFDVYHHTVQSVLSGCQSLSSPNPFPQAFDVTSLV